MEIGPVTGVRAIAAVKARPAGEALSGVFDIENFARVGDETYTPSGSRSAGEPEDDWEEPAEGDSHSLQQPEDAPRNQINLFA